MKHVRAHIRIHVRTVALMTAAGLMLGACDNVREAVIPSKTPPDEFAVFSRAPLSLPPEYTLRVPEPGAERPQNVNPSDIAKQVTIGIVEEKPDLPQAETAGLAELFAKTGADEAEPDIRRLIDEETSVLAAEDKTVVDDLLFWKNQSGYGSAVDPEAEAKRIQENQALGDPLTKGDVPTIERGEKGLLQDLFN